MAQTGGSQIHALCDEAGEPLIPEVAEIMGAKQGERPAATAEEIWEQAAERIAYTGEYDHAWNATDKLTKCKRPMDALLMPNTGVVSWERGGVTYAGTCYSYSGYTPVGNVLQYSSISMPLAKAARIPREERNEFINDLDESVYEACMSSLSKTDNPETSAGMPIGIQLMGRRFQEEKILSIARLVESVISPPKPRASL